MSARILSGRDIAEVMRAEVAARVTALGERGKAVGLATVLVGDDAASKIYVDNKHRAARSVGILSLNHHLRAESSQDEVESCIRSLNEDGRVDGMIVQLPLPGDLDHNRVVAMVAPHKDVDGLHPYNLGLLLSDRPGPRPATPSGIMRVLQHYGIEISGRLAVVVGRSVLVGRPMALLLGARGADATVVQAHSRTPMLGNLTRTADILIVAAGCPGLVGPADVKPGATVIDVGTNRSHEGLVGDVDFAGVSKVAGAITPVPGGIGPVTIASLLQNTAVAAEACTD